MSKSIRVSIAAIAIACFISCMVAMGEFGLSGFAFGDDEGQTESGTNQVEVTNIDELDKTVDLEDGAVTVTANVPETDPAGATVTYTTSKDGGETWSDLQTEVPTMSEEGTLKIKAYIEYVGFKSTEVEYTLTCCGKLRVWTASDTKEYDGKPLTNDDYVATWCGRSIHSGEYLNWTDRVEINVTGSVTDVAEGSVPNTCEVTIWRGWDNVTPDYVHKGKIVVAEGTLTVTKHHCSIWIATAPLTKKYDGVPLTDGGYTAVWGMSRVWNGSYLCGWDKLQIEGSATITDAGSVLNSRKVGVWRGDKEVTDNYDIDMHEGMLTIDQRQVTLISASDVKPYDGTPLQNDEVNVFGDGFARYVGADCIVVEGADYDVTGSQTEVGESRNKFTYTLNEYTKAENYDITTIAGTLMVYKNNNVIWVETESKTKMYDGEKLASDPSEPEAYTAYWGNQEVESGDTLCGNDVLEITFNESITDAGWKENVCTIKVLRDGEEVTNSYSISPFNKYGWLNVTKRLVTLTSVDAEKIYDGEALTAKEVVVGEAGFVEGQGVDYRFAGSQRNAGVSSNCFYYTFADGTNPDNYCVDVDWGKLEVTPRPVTLTSASAERVYDGTELTAKEVKAEYTGDPTKDAFVEGEGVGYEVYGSQTNAGRDDNDFIYWPQLGTNLYNYDIDKVVGTLTVKKRPVTLTSASATKIYDGTPLRAEEVEVSGDGFVEGEGATYKIFGKRTNVGSTKNIFTYKLNWGTCKDNYAITKVKGDLTVTKRHVTLTSGSAEKMYDGKPLTNTTPLVVGGEGFVGCQGLKSYTVLGSQTDAGTGKNEFKYELKSRTDPENYNIEVINGTLTVTPRSVELLSNYATKSYDGTPLTDYTVVAAGDGFADGEGATYDVTGSQLDAGSSDNTFTYKLHDGTKEGNYIITTTFGALTVTQNAAVIRVATASDTKLYDGTPLTNAGNSATWGEKSVMSGSTLCEGDVLTITNTGTITEVGTTPNTFTAQVMRGTTNVTANYTFADTHNLGTLEVTAKDTPTPTPTPWSGNTGTGGISSLTGDSTALIIGILVVVIVAAAVVTVIAIRRKSKNGGAE